MSGAGADDQRPPIHLCHLLEGVESLLAAPFRVAGNWSREQDDVGLGEVGGQRAAADSRVGPFDRSRLPDVERFSLRHVPAVVEEADLAGETAQ